MNWKLLSPLAILIISGCANQPQLTDSFDLGCEARRNGNVRSHIELQRLRCYLYYSDLFNAEKQIKVVENSLSENTHEFDEHTQRYLAYYKQIYKEAQATERSNKNIKGEYWPIVKGNPLYPFDAYENKIEGYVVVSINVSPEGNSESPKILKSSPVGVFAMVSSYSILSQEGGSRSKIVVRFRIDGYR